MVNPYHWWAFTPLLTPQPGKRHGRLVVRGPQLYDSAGPFALRLCTAFDAGRLFQTGRLAQLRQYFAWVRSVRGNGVRVFVRGWVVKGWDAGPDTGWLREFCAFMCEEQLLLLGTVICDQIPVGAPAQIAAVEAVADVFSTFDHCLGETANEPYNGNCDIATLRHNVRRPNLLWARGMCRPDSKPDPLDPHSTPYVPSLGVTTYQTGRAMDPNDWRLDDWPRKVGKDGKEVREGFGAFPGTKDFCWNNEMIGAAETRQLGRRSNNPELFFLAGAAAGMFQQAITAHGDSQTMQSCIVPGPIETKCVQALFHGLNSVPAAAPTWTYTRRGPAHPTEPMPVEPDPLDSEEVERMHAMVGPRQAVAVNYRYFRPGHDAWKPQGINGWRVTQQLGPLVILTR